MALGNNTWREGELRARAGAVEEYLFMDSSPNHFLLKNYGDSPIYAAMATEPSKKYHDVMIPAGGVKTMARLGACSRIFILNTSATAARVHITSFYREELAPEFIIGAAAAFSGSSGGSSGGAASGGGAGGPITGFEVSLPVGGNHIGSVLVDNTTSNPIPATLQGQALTYLSTLKNDIATVKEHQAQLETMVQSIMDIAGDLLAANSSAIGGAYLSGVTAVGETNGVTHNQAGKYISYFSNDGADTIKLALYNTSGTQMMVIDILAGEALSDVPIKFSKFKLWSVGAACSYRALILAE